MKNEFYTISKSFQFSFAFSLLFVFTFYSQSAKACVDPDTIATLTVNYNADLSEVEIRIGNLKLETETPNTFCACGLASTTEIFTYVTYIAVVDQGTNNVYPNFIPFEQSGPADAAWDGSQPALPDWNGYVAEVINGLEADDPVELIIRAQPPAGLIVELEEDPNNENNGLFWQTYLGTDEWDPGTMDLVESHQAIRTFAFMSNVTVNEQPQSYFDELDQLVNVYEVDHSPILAGKLSPNPVTNYFELSFGLSSSTDMTLVIYDINGKIVHSRPSQSLQSGQHNLSVPLDGILEESGIYIVSLQTISGQSNFKFVKQ